MTVLTVIAGPNGSGKSSFAQAFPVDTFDPDRIAAGYGEGFTVAANIRASREALLLAQQALEARKPLAVETTLAGRQPLRLMRHAKNLGYEIHLIFIVSSAAEDTRLRIENRVLTGGHNIADTDLERRAPRILEHLPEAITLSDVMALYVSSVSRRDFSLEAARVDGVTQMTSAVPESLQRILNGSFRAQHVPAIGDAHPIVATFPVSVEQRLTP